MNELGDNLPIIRGILAILCNIFISSIFVKFKFSIKVTAIMLATIFLVGCEICYTVYTTGMVLTHPLLAAICQFLIILFLVFSISEVNIFRNIFITFLVINIFILSSSVGIIISSIFGMNVATEILARMIIYVPVIVFSIKYFRPFTSNTSLNSKHWILYDMIEAAFFGVFIGISMKFGLVGTIFCKVNALVLALCILMIFVYACVFTSIHAINVSNKAKLELERMRNKEALIQNELLLQEDFINSSKKLRHDIRHHGMVVLEYIKKGEIKKAEKYIERYFDISFISSFNVFCNNYCINSILHLYDSKLKIKNIEHTFLIRINNDINISDIDMCSLLSNMLENAYEAVMQCDVKNLTLKIEQNDSRLTFLLINSLKNSPEFENGVPKTTKEIGGLGTKIISDIVKKYGGIVDYNAKGDKFVTRCVINNFLGEAD